MKITAYSVVSDPLSLRSTPVTRAWMDRIPDQHAYRYPPLNIANSHGWEIASPCAFEVTWDGGVNAFNLKSRAIDDYRHLAQFALSNDNPGTPVAK